MNFSKEGHFPFTMSTTLLEQRIIEAKVLRRVYDEAVRRLGVDQAQQLLAAAIDVDSQAKGRELRARWPQGDLASFAAIWDTFAEGGALEVEFIERTPQRLHLAVRRCRYAEAYEEFGLKELGFTLSCRRDQALVEGFSNRITLTRPSTIMQGHPCCEFLFTEREI